MTGGLEIGESYDDGSGTRMLAAIAACLGGVALIGAALAFPPSPPPPLLSSTVKVQLAEGHGSGVHIGDGLILSAAHVASEGAVVKIKLSDGSLRDATVEWATKSSDVALLRMRADGIAASPLSCAPVVIGQPVTAHGNPLDVEFIHTYGHIVGDAAQRGPWDAVAVVDMEILPGMSGGPVLNDAGEVVGMAIGLLTLPLGFSSSATGIGFVVPSSVICGLLGRT